jgi:phosphocarrier protein HPr
MLISMVERKTFKIRNKLGLHARAAVKFVNISVKYESHISLEREGMEANGKSLLSILTLACPRGSRITISAEGKDASEALASLGKLIEDKFGED